MDSAADVYSHKNAQIHRHTYKSILFRCNFSSDEVEVWYCGALKLRLCKRPARVVFVHKRRVHVHMHSNLGSVAGEGH